VTDATLVAARLLLAAVFITAGLAKLANQGDFRRTLADFGLPSQLAAASIWTLPLAEVTIGLTLVPAATAHPAAIAAIGLLALFCVAIAGTLAQGSHPECSCFGPLRSAPVGRWTLLRNATLASLAMLILARAAPHTNWTQLAAASAAAAILAQGYLWLKLLHRYGRALRRIEELETPEPSGLPEAGTEAPPFVLPDLYGSQVSLDALCSEQPALVLVFTDPSCGACDLAFRETAGNRRQVVAVSTGPLEAVAAKAEEHHLENVLLDQKREVTTLYGVIGVPTALVVDDKGVVFSEPAIGSGEVAELLRSSSRLVGAPA
jgi:peroxiredoxin/uncharacterized membrane protein YphA (DoxX/SURF4 family)